jgi:hypothetical protein
MDEEGGMNPACAAEVGSYGGGGDEGRRSDSHSWSLRV